MKRYILCYGDSNTWGHIPGTCGTRFAEDKRWTGVLQQMLGTEYRILEAGLCGRTTTCDDPFDADLNGIRYLPACLRSAGPLDLVVLMLGTNDLKFQNAWSAARGAATIIRSIRMHADCFRGGNPQVLLVSPVHVTDAPSPVMSDPDSLFSRPESLKFARFYRGFAEDLGIPFFDAASVAEPSPLDGIHMDAVGHAALGAALADEILKIFPHVSVCDAAYPSHRS